MKEYKEEEKCFNLLLEKSVKANWMHPALSDYGSSKLTYAQMAEQMERLHLVFREIGIKEGDKIALCGRNCSGWAVAFFATITYGAVAVPILHEFKTEQIQNIVNHSESRLLFVSDNIWKELNEAKVGVSVPDFIGVLNLADFSVLEAIQNKLVSAFDSLDKNFASAYPDGLKAEDINYVKRAGDVMAVINYTSGSTGRSKGVMISQKNLWSNVQFAIDNLGDKIALAGEGTTVSILPMAHMYGLAFEILSEICLGMHIHFLTKLSPTIIFKAFSEVKPTIIISVPLIIEKIIRRAVMPKLNEPSVRFMMKIPGLGTFIRHKICKKITQAFGGRFFEVIIGGAALSEDVEEVLKSIGFRYTVGYGTTECAPLIAYDHWFDYKKGSCGKPIDRMEAMIDSDDPTKVVGEVLVRGENVMLGYYKNQEATDQTLIDGWYHTGDLGVMESDGTISIRGRSKNMLLGPNGQNIYPEELEDKFCSMPLVSESVVIQKKSRLYALVFPDADEVKRLNLDEKSLAKELDNIRMQVNKELPAYEQIVGVKVMPNEFEKTPKKSIKRFLYLDEEV
jgi:long-chain acyl-CoA synthetase